MSWDMRDRYYEEKEKVVKLEKEIQLLREELKRERKCTDFYAQNEIWVNENDRISIKWEDHFRKYPGDESVSGGKLARKTVKQRKIELQP